MHPGHKMMTVQSMLEAASGGGAYTFTEIVQAATCSADL